MAQLPSQPVLGIIILLNREIFMIQPNPIKPKMLLSRIWKSRGGELLTGERVTAFLMVLPLLLVVIGLLGYPLINAIILTFQRKIVGVPAVWIGLDNYYKLIFKDEVFPKLVRNTLVYTAASVMIKGVIGMGMALILNERIKGQTLFRGLLMVPWVISAAVVAMNWKWILSSSGVLSFVLVHLGLSDHYIPWLSSPTTAMISLVLVNVWANFPFFGVNFLASMQSIPAELYEAAEVDGASSWQRFLYITIPGLRQIILVLSTLSFIWTWNMFTHVWLITGGGPADNTQLVASYAYKVGLSGQQLGYAATVSLIFLPGLALAIGILSPLLLKSRED
jgi:multiple sugar transport system permease protein